MRILDVEQGSQEWLQARLGVITASEMGKLITSLKKPSSSFDAYVNKLVAERLMGQQTEDYTNPWMERGRELEEEARDWYELRTGNEVEQVGFCTLDHGLVGCSPDGLVDELGGLEIKCPKAETHVGYLRANKLPATYVPQVQACLWVTGREYWDFVSYHPLMPKLFVRVQRDQDFIDAMTDIVEKALTKAEKALKSIQEMDA